MKNVENIIVWAGSFYGNGDKHLDIWADVSEEENIEKKSVFFNMVIIFLGDDRRLYIS